MQMMPRLLRLSLMNLSLASGDTPAADFAEAALVDEPCECDKKKLYGSAAQFHNPIGSRQISDGVKNMYACCSKLPTKRRRIAPSSQPPET
jgi:hypothetical protein